MRATSSWCLRASRPVTPRAVRSCMMTCVARCASTRARAWSRSRRSRSTHPLQPGASSTSSRLRRFTPATGSSPPLERHPASSPDIVVVFLAILVPQERTSIMIRILGAALLAAACWSTGLAAQQPTQRQLDSLAAQVRQPRARVDSLLAASRAGPAQHPASAAAPPGDELARLRAAASQAAGAGDTIPAADTMARAIGRERNQAQLNPEIGATGDVRVYATTAGVQQNNFEPREFEIGFQSALDPYSHTKIFLSFENE